MWAPGSRRVPPRGGCGRAACGPRRQRPPRPPTLPPPTTTDHRQGFLPESVDAVVQGYLYPSYSPQMLLFLGLSSGYGLWKTGKLPGQQQM